MADRVKRVTYSYVKVPNRAGRSVEMLQQLKDAGVNLLAFSGFPAGGGKSQLDFVTDDMVGLRRVARANDWRLSKPKKGFLVVGSDRVGAALRHLQRLADKRINIVAADAVTAGAGRYGMILWVRPKDYARAARALKAR